MTRFLSALVAVVVACGFANAADAKKLTVRWHGQSFFELKTSAGTQIVFDPHAIEAFQPEPVKADLLLISHLHSDHVQTHMISNLKKAKVINGLKDERGDGKKVEWNSVDEKFKDVHVRTVGLYHDDMHGMSKGLNSAFILEVDGIKIVFLGDLGHTLSDAQIKKIGPVDVLFIPVGGVYTLNGEEAKEVVKQLKPTKYIFPMHYGTKIYDDLLTNEEFLEDQKNVKKYTTNEFIIDTSFKPKEPVIAVLHWLAKP